MLHHLRTLPCGQYVVHGLREHKTRQFGRCPDPAKLFLSIVTGDGLIANERPPAPAPVRLLRRPRALRRVRPRLITHAPCKAKPSRPSARSRGRAALSSRSHAHKRRSHARPASPAASLSHRGARAASSAPPPEHTRTHAHRLIPGARRNRLSHVRTRARSCRLMRALTRIRGPTPAAVASCRAPRGGAPSALPATCPDNCVTPDT